MNDTGHKVSAAVPASPIGRNQFGVLLESVPDAIVMVDSAGRIALVNTHAEKLFGYGPGELLGKPLGALLPERFRTSHAEHAGDYFARPRRRPMGAGIELFGLRKDGSEFPAEISLSPVQTESGAWAMSAIRDITDRKRIERELKEKNAALEAANQELQAFAYSVSHDLRAPWRAMGGFAGMLKKSLGPDLPPETGHAVKRIQDNVAKMSKLIDGLLDFSSLTWMALTKKTVNVTELAQSVFNELTLSSAGRRVDFKLEPLPACRADAILLRQVFANLLSNALKFTRERDPAVIRAGFRRENGEHVYFVQDNGAGFDMEYAGKLFRVFQRLHSPSEFEGTGVGLAIVQRIVQRHGGRVWAESEVDRGATFYFTLGEATHGNSA
jgi:PAS domain S-box-containing protein